MKKHHRQNRNQGEGDRVSARHYNKRVREFVNAGKVAPAATSARAAVDRDPAAAARAELAAKRGPRGVSVSIDEIVAKGRTVVERVKPIIERAATKIRARFGRNTSRSLS
jgi:hypothetical protein